MMTANLEANKQVVDRFNDLLGKADFDAASELTTNDFTWFALLGRQTIPRANAFSMLKTFTSELFKEPVVYKTVSMIAQSDSVAAVVNGRGVKSDGGEYANLYHMLYELRDGKICRLLEFNDTLYSNQAFGQN